MKKIFLILPIIASLVLFGCGTTNPNASCDTGVACPLPTTSGQQIQQTSLTGVAQQTILAIKNKDFATLATVASSNGVRFTPYENVKPATDIVLSTGQIANALSISAAYTRGNSDGSGLPIDLGIGQYRAQFVYDVDFATAPIQQWNHITQKGNTLNNLETVYANKQIIDYYFTGFDGQYGGADWRSLYLIFDQEAGAWKLIGVVHGGRTI
ncbi:MAG: hypothetical protein NTX91_00670 [candidate division SR1 bacterium]|nr:hypothetical protein [candidate division SR1 bacterium]